MSRQLAMAYSVCRGIARAQARNFYWAFVALPREKRNALCAVYAFMRHADDLSDEPGLTPEQRHARLEQWSESLVSAVQGTPSDDPIIMALADTQARFNIPVELFERLVYGTSLDLQFPRHAESVPVVSYATFDDLYSYCYYVASVVGLVCIRIFGYKDPAAEPLAELLGAAFKLTNIIRDVKEDASMGRIYFPQEDLQRFGLNAAHFSGSHFANGFQPSHFVPLLRFEADRAEEFYKASGRLLPLIDEDSRPCLWALVEIYHRLLLKIREREFNVFAGRISLSFAEKMSVLGRAMLQVIF
jgi:phytoene synthase